MLGVRQGLRPFFSTLLGRSRRAVSSSFEEFQCIVPVDFDLSTEDGFLGITSLELLGLLD